jgi:hypothetical protein
MVRRVPQRDTESMIAWVQRFLEVNSRALRTRKFAQRFARRIRERALDRKTA